MGVGLWQLWNTLVIVPASRKSFTDCEEEAFTFPAAAALHTSGQGVSANALRDLRVKQNQ